MRSLHGRYPVEFDILGYTPAPWEPQHSLIVARLMAWEMGLSWWTDLTMADVIAKVGPHKALEAIPGGREYLSEAILQKDSALFADTRVFNNTYQNMVRMLASAGISAGSNCWAVNGFKTIRGKPILANDPHLRQAQPAQ